MGKRGRKKSFESWLFDFEGQVDSKIRLGNGPCKTCEFCFPGEDGGYVCADAHYGEKVDINDATERDCWSIGLDEYVRRRQKIEINMFSLEKLRELYQAYLHGEESPIIKAVDEIVKKALG